MADGGDPIPSHAATPGPADGRRCVVWVPPEGAAPTRLLAGLALRRVPVAVVLDAPSIMLQLAESPHPGAHPGAQHPRAGVVALIVVEPGDQPHLRELLTSVRTYHPQLAMWQYQATGGGLTRLTTDTRPQAEPIPPADSADTVDEGGTSRAEADPVSRHSTASPAAPTAHADNARPAAHRWLSDADHPTPLITSEELDMLLGPIESLEPEPPRR